MTHPIAHPDVIDQLAGIRRGDPLDALRAQRPQAREQAQQSFVALFDPVALPQGEPTRFTRVERFAVAAFVAGLHGQAESTAFHRRGLAGAGAPPQVLEAIDAEAAAGAARGPYGRFPAGPLSIEDRPGPVHTVSDARREVIGERLAAALSHAHLLVLHPRDARAVDLQALLDAGWSSTDIVTLSQLVAFLSFQIRVVAGLRALGARPGSASLPSSSKLSATA